MRPEDVSGALIPDEVLIGRKGGEGDFPAEEPVEGAEEALTEPEDTGSDEPSDDNTAATGEAEPDAGGEKGVDEPAASGGPPEAIPYERFKEVLDDRNALREQNQLIQRLVETNPELAKALGVTKADAAAETPKEEKPLLPEPPEGWQPESDGERYLLGVVEQLSQRLEQVTGTVQGVSQLTETQQLAELTTRFDTQVDSLAKAAGLVDGEGKVSLTDEDREAIAEQAAIYGHGARAMGKQMSLEDAVSSAFIMVRNRPGASQPAVDPQVKAKAEADARAKAAARAAGAGRSPVPAAGRTAPDVAQETVAQTAARIAKEKGLTFGSEE